MWSRDLDPDDTQDIPVTIVPADEPDDTMDDTQPIPYVLAGAGPGICRRCTARGGAHYLTCPALRDGAVR